jgi:hypothetical protein
MPFHCLAQELLSGRQFAPFAEPELDGIAIAIDHAVQVHPAASVSNMGFIDMPLVGDRALAPIELLEQERGMMNGPAVDGGVVDDASFSHHLFQVPKAKIVGQMPPHAEQDHRSVKLPVVEHATLRPITEKAVAETLK